jgi:hypothetical protein
MKFNDVQVHKHPQVSPHTPTRMRMVVGPEGTLHIHTRPTGSAFFSQFFQFIEVNPVKMAPCCGCGSRIRREHAHDCFIAPGNLPKELNDPVTGWLSRDYIGWQLERLAS